MSSNLTIWLANVGSVLVILGFGWRPVKRKLDADRELKRTVDDIKKELHPNGGTSLKDAVTRIEYRQMNTKEDVTRLEEKLDDHIDFHMRDGR